ncbi:MULTISPECIES: hypothetical protein [unclassified Prochlorococcus]|uniref:hypothetical protein n=1 Tax=unclassified Prochlorococcus TaxID=2627481 RepID=UPI0005339679|nr:MULTISPECIES: hypothetical protein [unclassified Prochlorococcus]KGG16152.1 hypothetical protein EV06_0862 [Prochlorococcus sp. MIT 0602]KGG17272.1 hypothetical protein EV07_0710 [Prochlorococcus sp. MIT 0603]
MPTATKAPSPIRVRSKFSRQSQFAISKLIQNLGSNQEQYKFLGNLRTAYGRD